MSEHTKVVDPDEGVFMWVGADEAPERGQNAEMTLQINKDAPQVVVIDFDRWKESLESEPGTRNRRIRIEVRGKEGA